MKGALKLISFLAGLCAFWYTGPFLGAVLWKNTVGELSAVFAAVLVSVAIYLLAMIILTRLVFGKMEL